MNITKYKLKQRYLNIDDELHKYNYKKHVKQFKCILNYTKSIIIYCFTHVVYEHGIEFKKLMLPNSIHNIYYKHQHRTKYANFAIYPNNIKFYNITYESDYHGMTIKEFIQHNVLNNIFCNNLQFNCNFNYDKFGNIVSKKMEQNNIFLLENVLNIKIHDGSLTKNMYFLKNIKNINLFSTKIVASNYFLLKNIKYLSVYNYHCCKIYVANTYVLILDDCNDILNYKSFRNIKKIEMVRSETEKERICENESLKNSKNSEQYNLYKRYKLNANYLKNVHTVILHNCTEYINNISMLKNTYVLIIDNCAEHLT